MTSISTAGFEGLAEQQTPEHTRWSDPSRAAGLTLLLGGALALVGNFVCPGKEFADVSSAAWVPGHDLVMLSFGLTLLGLPALYRVVTRRVAWLGVIGYLCLFIRTALSMASHLYEARVVPVLVHHHAVSVSASATSPLHDIYGGWGPPLSLVLAAGSIAFALALVRGAPTCRAAAVLIGLGAVAGVAIPPIGIIMWEIGLGLLGLRLWRRGTIDRLRAK